MEQLIEEKMEYLQKYAPFIDFVLQIDEKKYVKFKNIRKWIVLKKNKYPLSDLNKIEQSIITQYKNLLIENNVQIPQKISNIFAPMNIKQYVNLCSDEEEDETQEVHKKKEDTSTAVKPIVSKERRKTNDNCCNSRKDEDSDDDLEIVSDDYVNKMKERIEQNTQNNTNTGSSKVAAKQEVYVDISNDLLSKIDKLTEDDVKLKKSSVHEPINYTYQEKDYCGISEDNGETGEAAVIFQRRTTSDVLFKRRADFKDEVNEVTDLENNQDTKEIANLKDDEVEVQCFKNNKIFFAKQAIEIISLDSCSDSEAHCDDERPSTSKAAAKTVKRAKKTVYVKATALEENEKLSDENNSNSSKKKVELLCNSIDSVDINELMDELKDTNETHDASATKSSDLLKNQTSGSSSNKENSIQPTDTNSTFSLNQEQICKLFEDISNKKDFDLDTFYAALEYVKQMNTATSSKTNPLESPPTHTPPPAPPPVSYYNNFSTPPVHPLHQQHQSSPQYPLNHPQNVYYSAQQPQNLTPPLTPHYPQNDNFVNTAGVASPPRPKVNINDPRIIKQLRAIQNTPLFPFNALNAETAASIMQICQTQKFQQPQLQRTNLQTSSTPHQNFSMAPANNTASTSKNFRKTNDTAASSKSLTYGEYKRRQIEQKLQLERQREEERKAKAEKQMQQEKQELLKKKDDEIRSQILSTLTPCKEQLTTLWSQQKNLKTNTVLGGHKPANVEQQIQGEKEKQLQNPTTPNVENNNESGKEKKSKVITTKKGYNNNNNKEADTTQNRANNVDQKLNRVYNELKCSVKGFDQIHDYVHQVDQNAFGISSDTISSQSTEPLYTPRPIGLRRRSSIYALSAISEQLRENSSDNSDCYTSQNKISRPQSTVGPKRHSTDAFNNSSSECLSQDPTKSFPKRRKTIDEVIKTTRRTKTLRILDDDCTSCSSDDDKTSRNSKAGLIIIQPVVKVQRISDEFIRKHTRRLREERDQSSKTNKNCERITKTVEPAKKLPKLKKYNNDCQMTERTTSFCALCRSKPSDLTNHYIGRHKTESYVSRLDWSELDDMSINTPFAKLLPKTKNYRFDRYEVECPFCKEKLVDQFINLYHHYSAHTGEYAFQCSHCHLTKPYRPDIQSHILHSKTCRSSTVNILYRYPPSAQCIYLHICNICNFVQLNEANVLKHLREHHSSFKAISSNVQKYILAAMSDGPDVNEVNKPPTPTPTPATKPPVPKEKTVERVERIPTTTATPSPPVHRETTVHRVERIHEKSSSTTTACRSSSSTTNDLKVEQQATTSVLDFKVDDDDIPVTNEPCVDEEFLEEGNCSLEEQLKQLHEGPTPTMNSQAPMTVIHCLGNHLKDSPDAVTTHTARSPPPDRHLPMILKTELMEMEENCLITPPRPSSYKTKESNPVAGNHSGIYEKYRSYPQNVNYLGLYKCMIDDCYYSTDSPEDLCTHIIDHSSDELNCSEHLQCPYCNLPMGTTMSPLQLVEHVRSQHEHLIYQCSMCCYRSCDASNVHVHQQLHHNAALDSCKIYKCSSDDLIKDNNKLMRIDFNEQVVKNIFKVDCKICNTGFYHTQCLINHLNYKHNVHDSGGLEIYSCIYCPLTTVNKNEIRIHIATKHPGKLPRVYDRNTQCNIITEDVIRSSDIVCLSESVAYEEIRLAVSDSNKENIPQDIKPDLESLLQMNEETSRVRLRKVTAHTGVPPDKLYRCPESTCGGFFSIFDLWLRHMKNRHRCLECQCPHCPAPKSLSLEQFSLHFEEHRRHTFICFHCPATNPNETLAKQHFAEKHADLGTMRFEQIRFNLCYSYSIMIQSDLCKERQNFIAEFLVTLDNRLQELESGEIQKLKHEWPVHENTEWLADYLELLDNRKVRRSCLIKACPFRTLREDDLFKHLRNSHAIEGTLYNCSLCEYSIEVSSFDEIINHIKLHKPFICICAACSLSTSSRSKMCTHIAEQHSARDVPVIQLIKTNQELLTKIYIVFSDNHLTFSTMRNCFCCPEKNMDGDVFSLHLKRYHKFSLNYYCEKCSSFHFKSLKDVKSHFQQMHPSDKLKVRCELSSPNDLSVKSLNEFQVQISNGVEQPLISCSFNIKDEPLDISNTDFDDVIMLEDNDIVLQDSLRNEQLQQPKEIPKLKCASLSKLIQPSSSMQPNCLPMQQVFHQHSTSASIPTTRFVTIPYGSNNSGALHNHTNVSITHTSTLNSMPSGSTNSALCNRLPTSGYMPQQIKSLPSTSLTNDRYNSGTYAHHVPNNLYMGETRLIQTPGNNSMSGTTIITQNYAAVPTLYGQRKV